MELIYGTGNAQDKSQGIGAFFLRLAWFEDRKKAPPLRLHFENPFRFLNIFKKNQGGAFFWASLTCKSKKKLHPLGPIPEHYLYVIEIVETSQPQFNGINKPVTRAKHKNGVQLGPSNRGNELVL